MNIIEGQTPLRVEKAKMQKLADIEIAVIHHTGIPLDQEQTGFFVHVKKLSEGFDYLPYHYIIRQDGTVEKTVPRSVSVPPGKCISIALAGDFEKELPFAEQIRSLKLLLKMLNERFKFKRVVPAYKVIKGTSSPGKNLMPALENNKILRY